MIHQHFPNHVDLFVAKHKSQNTNQKLKCLTKTTTKKELHTVKSNAALKKQATKNVKQKIPLTFAKSISL